MILLRHCALILVRNEKSYTRASESFSISNSSFVILLKVEL